MKAQIADGLEAYWNFDGDDFVDLIGEFDGTPQGSTPIAFVDGQAGFGRAIQLDGEDQYVLITGGAPDDLAFAGGSMSVAGWFRVAAFDTSWQALIAKGEDTNWRVHRGGDTSYLAARMGRMGAVDDLTGGPVVNDGQWHHFAAIADHTDPGGVFLYVDGQLAGSTTSLPVLASNGLRVRIGDNPGAPNREWEGELDDLAIWSRPLTVDEVLLLANAPLSSLLGGEAGFVLDPSSLTILEGQDLTLSVAVKGEPPITVQWYKGSEPIPSATHLTFPVINAMVADSGNYHAIAYNAFSIATSGVAVVEVQAGDFGPEVHFAEGFETAQALDDWTWGAPWEIGVPTTGPGSAQTGTHCAATVLAGDYTEPTDGRLVSPPFVVPPAVANPRLRFWQWFEIYPFGSSPDRGYVEVKAGDGAWQQVSDNIINSGGGVWTRPAIDLQAYAGQTVQVAFHFESARGNFTGETTRAGWYIDEVRLLHDSVLTLTESVVMRSQETACIPVSIAASSPASTVSFTLHAPADNLSDLALDMDGCWAASTIVPQGESEWQVTLQNECAETHMGLQDVGRLCFKAVSAQSAFVPLTIRELSVTYQEGSLTTPIYSWGNRAVVIANEPLLEAWQTTNGEQMVTLFGKPFTTYDIRQSTDVDTPRPWGMGWTETVPFGLFLGGPVQGELSSAPILFLDATEQ